MAQLGSAPALGAGGREFKSPHPDRRNTKPGLEYGPFAGLHGFGVRACCARSPEVLRSFAWGHGDHSGASARCARAGGRPCTRHPETGKRVTGPTTFTTKADCTRWLATVEADLHRGDDLDPAGRSAAISGRTPSSWLAAKTELRPHTIELYSYLLNSHILPHAGRRADRADQHRDGAGLELVDPLGNHQRHHRGEGLPAAAPDPASRRRRPTDPGEPVPAQRRGDRAQPRAPDPQPRRSRPPGRHHLRPGSEPWSCSPRSPGSAKASASASLADISTLTPTRPPSPSSESDRPHRQPGLDLPGPQNRRRRPHPRAARSAGRRAALPPRPVRRARRRRSGVHRRAIRRPPRPR